MKHFTKLLLIVIFCTSFSKLKAQVDIGDSLALVDLYNSTDGANWNDNTGWLQKPVDKWHGINVTDNRVIRIYLSSNNLSGSIPESIGNLSALEHLQVPFNQLNHIPQSIGNLTSLQTLDLSSNQLRGNIPGSICNLHFLKHLDLMYNQLTGSIPDSIGNLTALKDLYLNNNQLNGNIPNSIGNLSELQILELLENQLAGSIPESIGNLFNVQLLWLSDNQLSSNIPENIGNLSALKLLWLQNNQLSGSIPESIGNLAVLDELYLNNNQLSGNIPESVGKLSLLFTLGLGNNQLSGKIPESIGNLPVLFGLNLGNNHLSGAIPASLLNLNRFASMDLSYDNFIFDGMEEVAERFVYLDYGSQGIIPLNQQGNSLSVSAGGTLSNNTYYWYKDGELVATTTGDSTYTITEDGTYNVNVTNSICMQLTLFSDTITTNILPITLLSFTAAKQNNNALLNWSTSNEINTKEFIIQRSTNGNSFINIGTVSAKGNSSSESQYSFTDASITALNANKIYYRLLQTDNDGKSTFSKAVVLNIALQNSFVVYPNPVKNMLHIQANAAAVINIINSEGKVVLVKTINGNAEISVSNLPAGLYYVKNITTGEVRKIVMVR